MNGIRRHVRTHAVAYVALGLAIGAGGGYAFAASPSKTITVCANKKTGLLYLKDGRRCKRGQIKLSWNKQGPQGIQGPQGPPGTPAASASAVVAGPGTVIGGQGLTVQHVSSGDYMVTVTASACAGRFNGPVVSVSDGYPPNGQSAGAFPIAWITDTGTNQQFTVHTGVVVGGSFSPTDHTFNVQDTCS